MFRSVTLVTMGLGLAFAFGAFAAFTDKTGHWVLFSTGLLTCTAVAFLTGRYSNEAWAVLLGATIGLAAPVLAMVGNYSVHQVGIGGLESRDFGSPDTPGEAYILLSLVIFSPVLAVTSALTGFLAWFGRSRSRAPAGHRASPARG